MGERQARVDYLLWAGAQLAQGDRTCPGCGDNHSRLVRRKYWVTSLRECPNCHLRFRLPKETSERAEKLYKRETYRQGFTTALPSQEELSRLLETHFAGTEKDYAPYVEVLRSLLAPGATILDFGSSWGYGSWQIERAGFVVFSYEVGQDRARYAREHLNCKMIEDLGTIAGTIDCFFSSHVIEHLPDPNLLFCEAARLLKPGGYLVCLCPNGNPDRERVDPNYHKVWGKVHPLYITPEFMRWACARHSLELSELSFPGRTNLSSELLTIARKTA
jgi:2-polyprenyl-3-methyl-5-hydroxy-6-metoxy-1,4-benzoquinol methylase